MTESLCAPQQIKAVTPETATYENLANLKQNLLEEDDALIDEWFAEVTAKRLYVLVDEQENEVNNANQNRK